MKLTSLVLAATVSANNFTDRYIMDDPICPDVETCFGDKGVVGGMKCKGKTFTSPKGRIRLQSKTKQYAASFNCRWEIKAPKGWKVRIKITQGKNKFGIEHHQNCGYDRLHIQGGNGDRYGRLCSTSEWSGLAYNGLQAIYSYEQTKIESKLWRDWITLPTNHLVIGFDSDRLNEDNRGFRMVFDTYADYVVPNEVREEIKSLKIEEQTLMDSMFTTEDKFYNRIVKKIQDHHDQIFEKWHACGGASMDPSLEKPKKLERGNNVIDRTAEIQEIYTRYRAFIQAQLEDVGNCKPQHVKKILAKKESLEKMFLAMCRKKNKCL